MKNEPKYKCRACGDVWNRSMTRSRLYGNPVIKLCGDAFCGGTCDPVKDNPQPAEKPMP